MSRYTQYFGQNNVKSELAVGISSIATTIQVSENQGNLRGENFPVLGTLEHFDSTGKVSKREIVKVESRSGDTFTVVRKFAPCPPSDDATSQSAVSSSFDPGDSFSVYIPYEILNSVSEAINDLYNNGNDRLFLKKTSGLGFEITPGNVRFETGEAYYPGGTGTVVDNSMNYVMLDSSFNIIVNQEELFDVQNISIAEVKAVNGEITEITTRKIDGIAGRMGGGGDPVYGDGSDGDLVISENTILNAGQQYQFSNLTICPGAVVSFSGNGGAKIRVANLFCNMGTIDTTDIDVDAHEYRDSTSFCLLCNCAFSFVEYGKGGQTTGCIFNDCNRTGLSIRDPGHSGGCAYSEPGPGGICCNGGATSNTASGCVGYMCGAGGGGGGMLQDGYGRTSSGGSGGAGSGYNGGDGGMGAGATGCSGGIATQGGGGGGGYYTGKGGNGGQGGNPRGGYRGTNYTQDPCARHFISGGPGGNGGILGNGGNGGNGGANLAGGPGGMGICGGKGGDGGVGYGPSCVNLQRFGSGGDGGQGGTGYYGGNGGKGGGAQLTPSCCRTFPLSGKGGTGGKGIVPGKGGDGGDGGLYGCYSFPTACYSSTNVLGTGGAGGEGRSRLHSLNIKAKCFCNTGCILSVGSVGGQGGCGGSMICCNYEPLCCIIPGRGGNGGKGGQGGMIQIITDEILERGTISVAGGIGGQPGEGGCNACHRTCPKASSGSQGPSGDSGTLYFFMLEG